MEKLDEVTILEVGPRDGSPNVAVQIPTEDKIRVVNELVEAGLKHIETSSFVNPKWIPRLAVTCCGECGTESWRPNFASRLPMRSTSRAQSSSRPAANHISNRLHVV